MSRTSPRHLPSHRNIKLDSFLRRNTEPAVYEQVRAYEPCVVVSETVNKAYMHVVLSGERVYLTEYPPRTLTAAFNFGRVRDIELVNDFPDFLCGKDRDCCQHIRIVYVADRPAVKGAVWLRRCEGAGLPPSAAPPSRRTSHCASGARNFGGGNTAERSHSEWRKWEDHEIKPVRSPSCPNPKTLGLLTVPRPPAAAPSLYSPILPPSPSAQSLKTLDSGQVPMSIGSVLSRLLRRGSAISGEEREAELHLYAMSQMSRLYLHLHSLWNSFLIRSTLLLDPMYRRKCNPSSVISWERTAHLFRHLSSELLQDGIGVECLYLLLQELRSAASRSVTLRRLFWRSGEVCVFLVQTLETSLHGHQNLGGVCTADRLLLSTLIVQTLALMFRDTEVETARLDLLSATKGALASRMLLALICDPHLQRENQGSLSDSELQALLSEYLDAACSLLFELLLLGHESGRCFPAGNLLSVGWILRVLHPQPHLLSFIGYQAQQVVLVLSDQQKSALSPVQSVLLFQRCRLLLACLQYNSYLAQHLRSQFTEEFRYFVKPSHAEEKLPPCYPISLPTRRLAEHILALVLHR